MDGTHVLMQVTLFLLLPVGAGLLAVISIMAVMIVFSMAPGLAGLIPRLKERAKKSMTRSRDTGALRGGSLKG